MQIVKFSAKVGLTLIFSLVLSSQLCADDLDGKSNLICAAKTVVGCAYNSDCAQGSSDEFDLPDFMLVDFAKKQIHATKESGIENVSTFASSQITEQQIILQGVENHRGWSAAIDRQSGRLSVSSVGADVSLILFGRCTKI